ncbi:DUF4845 domain-containing protein [Pseudomonas mangrovi]|jgi:hypothetical protein|uniref:DUF4845 domain-containing protein n=1 Tax=Pseudomonas mangrovi TaxID=2161748 RepID=A0A2T5PEI7_9PSED|nr:DUF4845 domain-containing protein [Pseudomonas mangrovi]PTU76117.1 DUF4845 domain-containing protein [Pseudomonas mangrovi]
MTFAHKQKGMSMLSWMVVLVLVAFFASAGFKLIPHYMDNRALDRMITAVESDPTTKIRSVPEFYTYLFKGIQVNAIDLKPEEVFDIKLENNVYLVKLKYEQREPLIKNIDLVVSFDKEYRVRMQ